MDYKEDLRKRLPELKKIEGFPLGEDEDIINLSNPPFYTACPNPYIEEFIEKNGTKYNEANDDYHREPYAADVSEGKGNAIYTAHSYHTKVPHPAIMKYIEHYTVKSDIVLDGFSGSGMTGIAGQFTERNVILSDLSPAAGLIGHNFNHPKKKYSYLAREIYQKVKEKCSWMYETRHQLENRNYSSDKCEINCIVWSDVYECGYCGFEHNLWDDAIDREKGSVLSEYSCPNCKAIITKKDRKKVFKKVHDSIANEEIEIALEIPVLINYTYRGKRFEKRPDEFDLSLIKQINDINIPYWFPINEVPDGDNLTQPKSSHGIKRIYHFYTKRNLYLLSYLFELCKNDDLLFLFTGMLTRSSKQARFLAKNYFHGGGGWVGTSLSGTLFIPSLAVEVCPLLTLKNRITKNIELPYKSNVIVSSQSTTDLKNIPSNSIDYIFTDPPFGSNLMYSELNFIWESWTKTWSNTKNEAIVSRSQNKDIDIYFKLMEKALNEYFRILKPKRWITVEFNNSKSSIWNVIQDAINRAGFIIAQVSVLDKKQGSFKQVTSPASVKSDLVISAFKPSNSLIKRLSEFDGKNSELNFINEFLNNQPIKPIIERTDKMLYSKIVSYYIRRGFEVSIDANRFYSLLRENFIEDNGYWFTANQINSYLEYKKNMKLEGMEELKKGSLMLFVSDERSALIWLYNFLTQPKTFSEIHTAFTQLANIQGDQVPELLLLLEDNFIKENDVFRRPKTQVEHSNINTKREKALMREFESMLLRAKSERKKIKEVRKEALIYGFEVCYKDKRFKDILILEERLDKKIIENSSELNDFVEAAKIMVEGIN